MTAETSARPERVLEAARDFSERRADVWPNVSVDQLEVHERGDTFADVTEGLFRGVFWERCRYDWSQPSAVTATAGSSKLSVPTNNRLPAIPWAPALRAQPPYHAMNGSKRMRNAAAVSPPAGRELRSPGTGGDRRASGST